MTAYTAPRELPVEAVFPGDQILVHRDDTGDRWAEVIRTEACADDQCPRGVMCRGVLVYPATSVHYDRADLIVRIPCKPEPATTPAGPAPDDRVWVSGARKDIEMHSLPAVNAASTGCGWSTRTGTTALASYARQIWQSKPCKRCWPGTS